jgi:AcrR family transcriptional regulator
MARPKATIEPSALVGAFAAHGVDGVSSDQLADAAGVAKPTLYAHGHTKETLYLLAVETEVERLLERLHRADRVTRGRGARDRAKGTAHAILNHAAARPDGLRLIARAANGRGARGADPAATAVSRIPEWIAATLRRDLGADRLDTTLAPFLAHAIWGATLALAAAPTRDRRPNRERLAALAASPVPPPPSLPHDQWPVTI